MEKALLDIPFTPYSVEKGGPVLRGSRDSESTHREFSAIARGVNARNFASIS